MPRTNSVMRAILPSYLLLMEQGGASLPGASFRFVPLETDRHPVTIWFSEDGLTAQVEIGDESFDVLPATARKLRGRLTRASVADPKDTSTGPTTIIPLDLEEVAQIERDLAIEIDDQS